MKRIRLNADIPEPLFKELRVSLIRKGKTIKQWVEAEAAKEVARSKDRP